MVRSGQQAPTSVAARDPRRIVFVEEPLLGELRRHFEAYRFVGTAYAVHHLIPTGRAKWGEPISEQALVRAYHRAAPTAGIPGASVPYDLRHTRIASWIDEGIPLDTVRALAGHTSITTTQRYIHLSPQRRRRQVLEAPHREWRIDYGA